MSDPVVFATAPPSSSGDLVSPSRSPPGSLPWTLGLHVTRAVLNGMLAKITSHHELLSFHFIISLMSLCYIFHLRLWGTLCSSRHSSAGHTVSIRPGTPSLCLVPERIPEDLPRNALLY